MIIFIAGHSYLGKLAAGFPNVMLQMQDPNHTQQLSMLLGPGSQIRKSFFFQRRSSNSISLARGVLDRRVAS